MSTPSRELDHAPSRAPYKHKLDRPTVLRHANPSTRHRLRRQIGVDPRQRSSCTRRRSSV